MSGYAVGHVLRTSHFKGTALLVLIVIAEATHQDGTGAWPSVESIARLARTTKRSVYRLLPAMARAGELVIDHGAGPHGTNLYAIPGVGQLRLGDDMRVTPDNVSPLTRRRSGMTTASRGDDKAMSPNPSVTRHIEPSSRARARGARGSKEPRGTGLRAIGAILNEAQDAAR